MIIVFFFLLQPDRFGAAPQVRAPEERLEMKTFKRFQPAETLPGPDYESEAAAVLPVASLGNDNYRLYFKGENSDEEWPEPPSPSLSPPASPLYATIKEASLLTAESLALMSSATSFVCDRRSGAIPKRVLPSRPPPPPPLPPKLRIGK